MTQKWGGVRRHKGEKDTKWKRHKMRKTQNENVLILSPTQKKGEWVSSHGRNRRPSTAADAREKVLRLAAEAKATLSTPPPKSEGKWFDQGPWEVFLQCQPGFPVQVFLLLESWPIFAIGLFKLNQEGRREEETAKGSVTAGQGVASQENAKLSSNSMRGPTPSASLIEVQLGRLRAVGGRSWQSQPHVQWPLLNLSLFYPRVANHSFRITIIL